MSFNPSNNVMTIFLVLKDLQRHNVNNQLRFFNLHTKTLRRRMKGEWKRERREAENRRRRGRGREAQRNQQEH